jgi:hypothetical protein
MAGSPAPAPGGTAKTNKTTASGHTFFFIEESPFQVGSILTYSSTKQNLFDGPRASFPLAKGEQREQGHSKKNRIGEQDRRTGTQHFVEGINIPSVVGYSQSRPFSPIGQQRYGEGGKENTA